MVDKNKTSEQKYDEVVFLLGRSNDRGSTGLPLGGLTPK